MKHETSKHAGTNMFTQIASNHQSYGAFLSEEIWRREDNFEYDIAAANEVLQQEREEEKWATVGDLDK